MEKKRQKSHGINRMRSLMEKRLEGPAFKASMKHVTLTSRIAWFKLPNTQFADCSGCSVSASRVMEIVWADERTGMEEEADGIRGIIMSRDIRYFGCF